MCTVVIEVPGDQATPIRLLAVRDEDPTRAWDPPGQWWPRNFPNTWGVRDRRANGAWLAYANQPGRLAVVLNRAAEVVEPSAGFTSRGTLVLDTIAGSVLQNPPSTPAFTLLDVHGGTAATVSWDGISLRRKLLAPGVHMIAHHDVNDQASPRIARWLPEFQALAGTPDDAWREAWLELLARSAELGPDDDRAIVRDNTAHGYPTLSLLACLAEIDESGVALGWAEFDPPGTWANPTFHSGGHRA